MIVANPPFNKGQEIQHVYHMGELSQTVVSVISNAYLGNTTKPYQQFRDWLEQKGALILQMPKNSFQQSGTAIGANLIIIQ